MTPASHSPSDRRHPEWLWAQALTHGQAYVYGLILGLLVDPGVRDAMRGWLSGANALLNLLAGGPR